MSHEHKLLQGLLAAPFTPFAPDGSLNLSVVEPFSHDLAAKGVTGVFICGTTGEFASLTTEERRLVAEAWRAATKSQGLKLVIHVGSNCLSEAQSLAAHAAELGADAISAVPPHYFKPDGVDTTVAFLGGIADAAQGLPFYYYDIPGLTGVNHGTARVMASCRERIAGFRGVKFSNLDMIELQRCLANAGEELDVLFGCDEALLAALALGVDGAVGSTYNYAAPLYQRIQAAFLEGDHTTARALQQQSVTLVTHLNAVSPLAAGKAILRELGFDFGPVRPPLRGLSSAQEDELRQQVRELAVFA